MVQHELPMEVTVAAAKRAKQSGVTVVWDPAPAEEIPTDAYPAIDVITPNQVEAQALTGVDVSDVPTATRAAHKILDRGVGAAVVKLGNQGAFYATPGESGYVAAPKVEVVDTVAAGDAFGGGLAVALGEGRTFLDAVRYGVMAGSAAVTKVGAQDSMPEPTAIQAMLRLM